MKSNVFIFIILLSGVYSAYSQVCTRTITQFIAAPGGYAIDGSAILRDSIGQVTLTFSNDFNTTPGPDLYVYLSKNNENPNTVGNDNVEVSSLDSSAGIQSFFVPLGVGINDYDNVLIHCKQYNHFWGGGTLGTVSGSCQATTIRENNGVFLLTVAPNPFHKEINISLTKKDTFYYDITVMDIKGVLVWKKNKVQSERLTFGSNFNPGLYFVNISHGDEHSIIKIVKY